MLRYTQIEAPSSRIACVATQTSTHQVAQSTGSTVPQLQVEVTDSNINDETDPSNDDTVK